LQNRKENLNLMSDDIIDAFYAEGLELLSEGFSYAGFVSEN
jgi:hypothetical protein